MKLKIATTPVGFPWRIQRLAGWKIPSSFYIDHYDIVLDYVQQVKEGLEFLKHKLNAIEIEYNGGDSGNFIYLNLKDVLLAKDILDNKSRNLIVSLIGTNLSNILCSSFSTVYLFKNDLVRLNLVFMHNHKINLIKRSSKHNLIYQ